MRYSSYMRMSKYGILIRSYSIVFWDSRCRMHARRPLHVRLASRRDPCALGGEDKGPPIMHQVSNSFNQRVFKDIQLFLDGAQTRLSTFDNLGPCKQHAIAPASQLKYRPELADSSYGSTQLMSFRFKSSLLEHLGVESQTYICFAGADDISVHDDVILHASSAF